jgi:hypothetical protein
VLKRRIVIVVCDDSGGLGNALQGLTLYIQLTAVH